MIGKHCICCPKGLTILAVPTETACMWAFAKSFKLNISLCWDQPKMMSTHTRAHSKLKVWLCWRTGRLWLFLKSVMAVLSQRYLLTSCSSLKKPNYFILTVLIEIDKYIEKCHNCGSKSCHMVQEDTDSEPKDFENERYDLQAEGPSLWIRHLQQGYALAWHTA